MKKFFIKLHLWLSIPVGLVISVICFSGAALVFEKEITRIIDKEIYFVEPQSDTQILSEQQVREAIAS
ncbi:MAG: PepSY domain-containing protein, partial [Bacteroidales bacterium]|nr:PepSY domain-containing protein [Bacteroidales bacterium]